MMELKEILRLNYPVSDKTASEVEACCRTVFVKKGDSIVVQGEVCEYLFFVKEGLFRVTHRHDRAEETLCFGTDGDPFTSVHSLFCGEPAQYSFEAIEDSVCLALPFSDVKRLEDENVEWLHWIKNLMEEQLFGFERRYVCLGTDDAYTRYKRFIRLRAPILNRIPLKYVAQYINVRPETLSRIRARFAREENGQDKDVPDFYPAR